MKETFQELERIVKKGEDINDNEAAFITYRHEQEEEFNKECRERRAAVEKELAALQATKDKRLAAHPGHPSTVASERSRNAESYQRCINSKVTVATPPGTSGAGQSSSAAMPRKSKKRRLSLGPSGRTIAGKKRFTEDEDRRVWELYNEGKNCHQIGEIIGRASASVQYRIDRVNKGPVWTQHGADMATSDLTYPAAQDMDEDDNDEDDNDDQQPENELDDDSSSDFNPDDDNDFE